MWVTWGAGKVNTDITRELLKSSDHRIRSAAINVLRFNINSFKDHEELVNAANDSHGRVRMSDSQGRVTCTEKWAQKFFK